MEKDIDAQEAAQRCYEAMSEVDDIQIGRELWRAFGQYYRLAKIDGARPALVIAGSHSTRRGGRESDHSRMARKGLNSRADW